MKKVIVLSVAVPLMLGSLNAQQKTSAVSQQNPALVSLSKDNTVFVYVDFLSGLDDLLTTVPAKQFRNNVTAFAKLNQVFPVPSAIMGDEGEYRGSFYPEIKTYITNGAKIFQRTTPTGYTPEFATWLKNTKRKNVLIGGISIDNCTLHTTLDLLRNGYNVFVMIDVSSTNNKLAEDAALQRLVKAGAVLTTWIAAASEMVKDWNSKEGAHLMQFVMMPHMAASTVGEAKDPSADMK
ncbi:MAG TPA: isochorismatase family protein [Chitinophagaceae bacterium]|jgi:nicotinamidase-related amidase|nr:isochorismatase family protein [Chitinophagaceae bacterium]